MADTSAPCVPLSSKYAVKIISAAVGGFLIEQFVYSAFKNRKRTKSANKSVEPSSFRGSAPYRGVLPIEIHRRLVLRMNFQYSAASPHCLQFTGLFHRKHPAIGHTEDRASSTFCPQASTAAVVCCWPASTCALICGWFSIAASYSRAASNDQPSQRTRRGSLGAGVLVGCPPGRAGRGGCRRGCAHVAGRTGSLLGIFLTLSPNRSKDSP